MTKLIGSDIEYAVYNPTVGQYFPAGVLPIKGTKGNPDPLNFGGVEIDCCGVEITPHPAYTAKEFAFNILSLKSEVAAMFPDIRLDTISEYTFESAILHEVREANRMGCSTDYNAWKRSRNPRPIAKGGYRTFGGHVHIEDGTPLTILACDLILGLWSAAYDKSERRQLYGKAGAYRPKPYGVEYRVLSNFWCDKEHFLKYVWESANFARSFTPDMLRTSFDRMGVSPEEVETLINSNGVSVSDYELMLTKAFPEHEVHYHAFLEAA